MNNQTPNQEQKPKKKSKKWLWIIGGIFFLIIIIAIAGGSQDNQSNKNITSNQGNSLLEEKTSNSNATSPDNTNVSQQQISYLVDIKGYKKTVYPTGEMGFDESATYTKNENELFISINTMPKDFWDKASSLKGINFYSENYDIEWNKKFIEGVEVGIGFATSEIIGGAFIIDDKLISFSANQGATVTKNKEILVNTVNDFLKEFIKNSKALK